MERLAADSGLTSATSLAFCKAIFWLAASSSSCSSCGEKGREGGKKIRSERCVRISRPLEAEEIHQVEEQSYGFSAFDKRRGGVFKQIGLPWSVPVRWPNCPQRWPRTHWAECLNTGLKEILHIKAYLWVCAQRAQTKNWHAVPEFLAEWFVGWI